MVLTDLFRKKADIAELTESRDIPGLIQLLLSRDHETQAAAVRALGKIGPDATPALIHALQKKNRLLRLGIVGALAEIRDNRALQALIDQTKDAKQ